MNEEEITRLGSILNKINMCCSELQCFINENGFDLIKNE